MIILVIMAIINFCVNGSVGAAYINRFHFSKNIYVT